MKFINVETPAPCLIRLYVCTNEEGGMYIYSQATDSEVAAYMDQVNTRDDVKKLMQETDDRLTEAMASDEALNALVVKLYGNSSDETTAAETTPTPETTAPETTAAPETTTPETKRSTMPEPLQMWMKRFMQKRMSRSRRSPDANGEEAGTLAGGQAIHRTGYNDGWSRVEYNGETCYISNRLSDYVGAQCRRRFYRSG